VTLQRLRAFRSDLRRAVAARRRTLAAIFAAAAVVSGISAARPPPPPTTPLVVAAHDLTAGTVLGVDDLDTVEWPSDAVPGGALATDDPALGRTVAAPMRAGELLTDVRLVQPSLLVGYSPQSVLATIRIADPATASVVHVGDVVAIVGANPQGGPTSASVLARDIRVVAMPAAPAESLAVSDGLVLVVAVDEAIALQLADAAVRLSLSVLLT